MEFRPLTESNIFPMTDAVKEWEKESPDTALFKNSAGSCSSFLAADIFHASKSPVLLIEPDSKRAESVSQECASLLGDENVTLFPGRDAVPYNMKSPFGPTVEKRFAAMNSCMSARKQLIVTPSITLLQKLPPPKDFFNTIINLHCGQELSQEKLCGWLDEAGFKRESSIETLGTYSVLGSVIDIFPFLTNDPVRLDFWGDMIDSIRLFDIFSHRSKKSVENIRIFPIKEFNFSEDDIDSALNFAQKVSEKHPESHARLKHSWKTLSDFEGIEWFLHLFDLPEITILDYLPQNSLIIWNDILSPAQRLKKYLENYGRHLKRVPDIFIPFISKPEQLLVQPETVEENSRFFKRIFIDTENVGQQEKSYNLNSIHQPAFGGKIKYLTEDIRSKALDGCSVYIICINKGHAERFLELVQTYTDDISILTGYMEAGFILSREKTAFYSENQIFNRTIRPQKKPGFKKGAPLIDFDSLIRGDYVVHVDHGIGKYLGIKRIKTGNTNRDCMVLQYGNGSSLHVPVDDFNKVQKYIGGENTQPRLSRLGTSSWEKAKKQTKESLKEMAHDLINLYAKRKYLKGIKFSGDQTWQREFEDAFIYKETDDQEQAIKDVKKDMESPQPMDRLICGDVGFGKTEVAMRAMFKAATDGYQTALLAPTTILAEQHAVTFSERMADFPVNIAVLNRFLSPKKVRTTLQKLENGKIDIIIGTHRLLSEDVVFKNLGLLVIDEEQRFGVRHKEKLKKYKYKVDVLSMTATPIPRTLHLSLSGARDLSIINTPPRNRLSVETYVMEENEEAVKNAVEDELERGGQVYIVHNRIKKLEQIREQIELSVPNARVETAHGQMKGKELEKIMTKFTAGKIDVLVSTVIIENGLDIPNVNTIIIYRADTMGLSQLYQLRGRVGRSTEQAFAYMLTPEKLIMDETTLKRLRTLEQYTELGSGFQIAMRDLEIRGAGNILGTRQHGCISAVGFELYCRLLKEAVDEIRGVQTADESNEKSNVKINIPLDAFIPPDYISKSSIRISVYQHMSSITNASEIDNYTEELADRFGAMPQPVSSLILIMKTAVLAKKRMISSVSINRLNELRLTFEGSDNSVAKRIKSLIEESGREFRVEYGDPVSVCTTLSSEKVYQQTLEACSILDKNSAPDNQPF